MCSLYLSQMSAEESRKPTSPPDDIEIEILPIPKVTQLIDGTIKITRDDVDRHFVVGNTGLTLSIDDIETGTTISPTMDFLPENEGDKYTRRARPMFILGFAFYELYKYAQAHPSELAWNDVPVEFNTNETMARLLETAFRESTHADLISIFRREEESYTNIQLELGDILSLPESDILIVRLRKLHDRAQQLKIEVPVDQDLEAIAPPDPVV